MSKKKFGLFGDADLFFARQARPLVDETKMRRFQGSKLIAGSLVLITLFIPYWYQLNWSRVFNTYYGHQVVIPYDIKNTEDDPKTEKQWKWFLKIFNILDLWTYVKSISKQVRS